MKAILLAVYDLKAGTYSGPPYGAPTRGVGERTFTELVRNPETLMHKYPEDFELHEVGEFDLATGLLKALEPRPNVYGRAVQYLQQGGGE